MTEAPMSEHPIAPPPELFAEWLAEAKRLHPGESTGFIAGEVAQLAYRAGADLELAACCVWLEWQTFCNHRDLIPSLRAARRPKPPSLKEQALDALAHIATGPNPTAFLDCQDIIRRALEQLPE